MVKDYPGSKLTREGRHHAEVAETPILRGVLVEATFTSQSEVEVVHGLGRAYIGAIQVASTEPAAVVNASAPSTASESGTDIKTRILLETASSWTGTVTMWVF